MLASFVSLKSALRRKRFCTETVVFFLHYRVTAIFLLFCCIFISADRFAGHKIDCLSKPNDEISIDVLNSYCWSTATYSITSSYLKEVGVHVPHPGVESSEKQEHYEYWNFYQYVHLVLFIQALLFYIPHMLWKGMEPEFIYTIKEEVQKTLFEGKDTDLTNSKEEIQKTPTEERKTPLSNSKEDDEEKTSLTNSKEEDEVEKTATNLTNISTFIEERWGSFNVTALKYFMCELVAFLNILIQAYLLDVFLHGKFISLGLFFETYYNSEVLSDPIRLFPIVTVCTFKRYGPSGYIDVMDALCVLPINAINGKIFLCLWIWFAILLPLTAASLIYLVIFCISPRFRAAFLKVSNILKPNHKDEFYIKLVTRDDSGFGDWFVLSSLKNNVEEHSFYNLTESILSKLPSEDEEA